MEEAFAADTPPGGLGAMAHAAALAWTPPGFAAFDAGGTAKPDATGNGDGVATRAESEPDPAAANGQNGPQDPDNPSITDAIDAMNAVPTADGGPRVIVQTARRAEGHEPGNEPLEIPEFLRGVQ